MRIMRFLPALGLAGLVILTAGPSQGQALRSGGGLTLRLREDLPQGFAIHESATISTMWPAMPCFSNLVLFDPLKPTHSVDTIVGELAERWAWQENYRKLVFNGMPGYPFVVVPHPFGSLDEAAVRSRADAALARIERLLLGEAEER